MAKRQNKTKLYTLPDQSISTSDNYTFKSQCDQLRGNIISPTFATEIIHQNKNQSNFQHLQDYNKLLGENKWLVEKCSALEKNNKELKDKWDTANKQLDKIMKGNSSLKKFFQLKNSSERTHIDIYLELVHLKNIYHKLEEEKNIISNDRMCLAQKLEDIENNYINKIKNQQNKIKDQIESKMKQQLQLKLKQQSEKRRQLESEKLKIIDQYHQLEKQYAELKILHQEVEKKRSQTNKTNSQLKEELKKIYQTVEKQKKQSEYMKNQYKNIHMQYQKSKQTLHQMERKIIKSQEYQTKQNSTKEQLINQLNQKISSLEQTNHQLTTTNHRLQLKIDTYENTINLKQAEIQCLELSINEWKQQGQNYKKLQLENIKKNNKEIIELKKRTQILQIQNQQLILTNQKLIAKEQQLLKQNRILEQQIQELKQKNIEKQNQTKKLMQIFEKSQKRKLQNQNNRIMKVKYSSGNKVIENIKQMISLLKQNYGHKQFYSINIGLKDQDIQNLLLQLSNLIKTSMASQQQLKKHYQLMKYKLNSYINQSNYSQQAVDYRLKLKQEIIVRLIKFVPDQFRNIVVDYLFLIDKAINQQQYDENENQRQQIANRLDFQSQKWKQKIKNMQKLLSQYGQEIKQLQKLKPKASKLDYETLNKMQIFKKYYR